MLMRRLLMVALLFAALAAVPAAEAQIRGTPPSVTSSNPRWTSTRPAASVTSLGPHGFSDFRGRDFGRHGFGRGSGFGVSVGFGHNPRFNIHFGSRFGSRRHFRRYRPAYVPVYVPYYYPSYPVVYGQPAPVAEAAYYDDRYDEPPALTVFERRSQYIRRDRYQDDRYGEHYFDAREEVRRELDERDARVRERRDAREEPYAPEPRDQENAGASAPEPAEDVPTTVLIFRDGTRREVKNYAIVGDTLWELSASRARKVPLSALDLKATMRVNEERGVDFRLPKSAGTSETRLPNLLDGRP